jgi:hypothetical protein
MVYTVEHLGSARMPWNACEMGSGYFFSRSPSPFVPDKVLTMCPEQGVNHVTG